MFGDLTQLSETQSSDLLAQEEIVESLGELERNVSEEIIKSRSATRLRIKSLVIAQPGNSSDRRKIKLQGMMGDISEGGSQILFPAPLHVGDIYWLTFDKDKLQIPSMFARCVRCNYLRDDAFEAGMKFFTPVDLSHVGSTLKEEDLFD